MENLFLIKMPFSYELKFKKNENYKYTPYKSKARTNLENILIKSSKGYCMYCYSKVIIDGKNYGHLEHSIEQATSSDLISCKHNLSLACPTCNLSFKKKQQKEREIEINKVFDCLNEECSQVPCKNYKSVLTKYVSNMCTKKLDKIIIKPHSIYLSESLDSLEIVYDLIELKFKPLDNKNYSKSHRLYIQSHIDKFNLNDEKYYTTEIKKVIEDLLEYNQIPPKERYHNLVAELFIEKLKQILSTSDLGMNYIKEYCLDLHSIMITKNF